jgi:hypothetical protein
VQLKNGAGTNLTTSGGTVALSTTAGTLSAVTDNNNGTYTATLTAPTTVGTATVSGTINGQAITDTENVSFVPGPAAKIVIVTQPSSTAQAGVAFPQQPVIRVQDASGNNVAQAGVTVTAAIASGGGTLGGTSTATSDASGAATFTNLSIGGTAGNRTLSFSSAPLTSATSNTINLTAGAAAAVTFSVQPSNVVASAAITPAVQVSMATARIQSRRKHRSSGRRLQLAKFSAAFRGDDGCIGAPAC